MRRASCSSAQRTARGRFVSCRSAAPSHPDYDMVDWVIGSFSAQEKKIVDEALDRALDAAECIISRGVTEAQNRFN